MEADIGNTTTFAHYIRTDKSGARPVPDEHLKRWIDQGWLERVTLPEPQELAPIPGTVLDPFCGSGTTLQVAADLGVNGIGIDLSPQYLDEHAKVRVGRTPSKALDELPLFAELEATP